MIIGVMKGSDNHFVGPVVCLPQLGVISSDGRKEKKVM